MSVTMTPEMTAEIVCRLISIGGETADYAAARIEELEAIVAKLPGWVSDLVDARNQLHGIRGSGMASRTIRDVKRAMAQAAEQEARTE